MTGIGARGARRRRAEHVAWTALRLAVGCAVLVATAALAVPAALAAWAITISNSGNQFGTASSFPNYPTSVTDDGAWAYHRGEESPSTAATSAAADSSGNSRPGTYGGTTTGPSTWWQMNDGAGVTAADSSGAANPGTLVNSPGWVTGAAGGGLSFDGSTKYVAGRGPAVRTNASLTVSAWVNLTDNTAGADDTAVSQAGSHTYAFLLGMDGATRKWVFKMTDSDVAGPAVKSVTSAALATAGAWTHLTGVYDTSTARIYLYVNGVAAGNIGKTLNWDATGALQSGRALVGDVWGQFLHGKVDDVRVYNRVLTTTEIANLAQTGPTVRWDFSEAPGSTTTADSGSLGNTGTVGSATTFVAGRVGNGVSMSNNVNGYVAGSAAAVRTDQSFSVAAWVNLSWMGTGAARTAVAQAGSASSGFILKYDSSGRWAFTMPQSDVGAPPNDQILSMGMAATDTWVHLAGVFDASADTIRLYVNGTSQGTVFHTAGNTWNATGAVQAGRAYWNNVFTDHWYGMLDSVRLYQRVLSAADVTALASDTDPATFTESAMTAGVRGALQGTYQGLSGTTAVAFAGGATAYNNTTMANPTVFTLECWIRVSGSLGGEVIGFHSNTSGSGGSHDRAL